MQVCRWLQTHSTAHPATSSTLIPSLQGCPCLSRLGALETSNQRNLQLLSYMHAHNHASSRDHHHPSGLLS